MKNRGGIVLLSIIMLALSVYYLSFSLITRSVEKKADAEAQKMVSDKKNFYTAKQEYLDSMMYEKVFSLGFANYTYKDAKELELNLGLDLKGGMHVTLEVSPVELVRQLAVNKKDSVLTKALRLAAEKQVKQGREKFSKLFLDAFLEINPNGQLRTLFASASSKEITSKSTNAEVISFIDERIEGAIDLSYDVLRTRIDKFGVTQPNIQRIENTGRIQIELPGVDNPKRVRKLLEGAAKLEFWEVAGIEEGMMGIAAADEYLVQKSEGTVVADTFGQSKIGKDTLNPDKGKDTLGTKQDTTGQTPTVQDSTKKRSPLVDLLAPESFYQTNNGGTQLRAFTYAGRDTAKINALLNDPKVREKMEERMPSRIKFLWSRTSISEDARRPVYELYPIRMGRSEKPLLEGDVIDFAKQEFGETGAAEVVMQMNARGTNEWRKITRASVGKQIAIVLDDQVCSAPVVRGEIPGGRSSISGNFSIEEAKDLANILMAGRFSAPVRVIEETVVGPTLGSEAQGQGIYSVLLGFALVVLFMCVYYAKAGVVSVAALFMNVFLILGFLAQLNASLTLPGIAGIVLTIGMAVDANVLIFERIREEIANGKSRAEAIELGFARAFWTIFDSNLTTLITALMLYVWGLGPIKGFAITLMIGILCSFFTAVYVSRVLISYWTRNGLSADKMTFSVPFTENLLTKLDFKFVAKRKAAYTFSAVFIAVGFALMFVKGLNLGVDFQGGRSYVVQFAKDVVPSDLKVALAKSFEGSSVEVKTFGAGNKLKITTSYMIGDESTAGDEKVQSVLVSGVEGFSGTKFSTASDAQPKDGEFVIVRSEKVGATIADDISDSALYSILFSLAGLFLYMFFRFRKWQFGFGAVVALFHDVLVVFSAFSIMNVLGVSYEIDQVFVAAILTVIGYSINDTVVVFDRVREFFGDANFTKAERAEIVDKSINGTMSRTLLTSFTTLLVVIILYAFGGQVLSGFAFALLVGIVFGTYSSIFIATPLVLDTWKDSPAKADEQTKAEVVVK